MYQYFSFKNRYTRASRDKNLLLPKIWDITLFQINNISFVTKYKHAAFNYLISEHYH